MDVTKQYLIAYKGLKIGEHSFDFKVDGSLFEAYDCEDIMGGACDVHVELLRSENMLELHTRIDGRVVVECDRCLEDCEVPVHFEAPLVVKFSAEVDEYDGDVMWISSLESDLDLMQYIYESIMLSLPYKRVHPDGQCDPQMIARFNIVSESEFATLEEHVQAEAATSQREAQSGEWSKLEALREQLTADHAQEDNK